MSHPQAQGQTQNITRCPGCELKQYMTATGLCRRCATPLIPPTPTPLPPAQPRHRRPVLPLRPASDPVRIPAHNGDGSNGHGDFARHLGAAIRAARLGKRLSQNQLGMNRAYLSRLESGDVIPSLPNLVALRSILGFSLDRIVDDFVTRPKKIDEPA